MGKGKTKAMKVTAAYPLHLSLPPSSQGGVAELRKAGGSGNVFFYQGHIPLGAWLD
jgi:hypothetical protein